MPIEPELQHVGYIGTIRHGKSETCISRIVPRVTTGKKEDRPALVVFDPPGTMARKIAIFLTLCGIKFFYDLIRSTAYCLGYAFGLRSDNPDIDQRDAENRQTIFEIIAALVRAEGKLDALKNPMLFRGLMDALLLYIYQDTPVPFYILKDCFDGATASAQYLLAHCTDPQVVLRFQFYHRLVGQQREYQVGAAERRLITVCDCPQFRKRCVETFDLADFLNNGGILLLDGSSTGNLSREDAALVMGMVLLLVIALARSGKLTRRVVIVIDEGMNTGILDKNVSRAMREAAKWNLEFHVLLQSPFTEDPEVSETILQCCDVIYFFKQTNPKASRLAAEICGTMTWSPMLIKEVIKRIRQIHDGVDIQKTEHGNTSKDDKGNKRTGTSEGHISIPRYRDEEVKEIVRYRPEEWIKKAERDFMIIGVGCCIIKFGSVVAEIYKETPLPLLPMPAQTNWPWQLSPRITLGERKLNTYLESLKDLSAYKTPETFQCTIPTTERNSGME